MLFHLCITCNQPQEIFLFTFLSHFFCYILTAWKAWSHTNRERGRDRQTESEPTQFRPDLPAFQGLSQDISIIKKAPMLTDLTPQDKDFASQLSYSHVHKSCSDTAPKLVWHTPIPSIVFPESKQSHNRGNCSTQGSHHGDHCRKYCISTSSFVTQDNAKYLVVSFNFNCCMAVLAFHSFPASTIMAGWCNLLLSQVFKHLTGFFFFLKCDPKLSKRCTTEEWNPNIITEKVKGEIGPMILVCPHLFSF